MNNNIINEDRDCSVCAETRPIEDFTGLHGCTHDPDVCNECIGQWLENEVGSTAVNFIPCSSTDCDFRVSYEDVDAYASDEVFSC
jgi:hypothetical protein